MKTIPQRRLFQAFTLVELLVSMTILSLLTLVIFEMIKQTQNSVTRQQARSEEFREARASIESISRNLSGAVMSSYWAYGDYKVANRVRYTRQSDNHFISGPVEALLADQVAVNHGHAMFFQSSDGHVSLGANPESIVGAPYNLITCLGYYIDYGSDLPSRPDFLSNDTPANPERKRFRLMEFRLPAEENILYSPTLNLNKAVAREPALGWFRGPFAKASGVTSDHAVPLADNVLALILQPRYIHTELTKLNENGSNKKENSKTTTKPSLDYFYDSREKQWGGTGEKAIASHHQLPPVIQLTLIAAEERSYEAAALKQGDSTLFDNINSLFNGKFTNYNSYEGDIETVEKGLVDLGLNSRTFTTNITLRGSKWVVEEQITP